MSASAWYEILVHGNPEQCQGLLTGLALGAGSEGKLIFAQDAGIHTPLGERFLDFVHAHVGVSHVITDAEGRELLKSFSKQLESAGFEIGEEKQITSARFEYEFHAYAPRYGDEIRAILGSLPAGVRHEGEPPKERTDKRAEGVEVYSPVHDYEIEGSGKISGPMDAVLEAHEELGDHPLVKVSDIELETA